MDNKTRAILQCLVFSFLLALTDAILCYQCSDASSNKEKTDCIYDSRRLARHRYLYENTAFQLDDLSSLKNCTPYDHPTKPGERFYNFCMIQTVETYGTTQAYMRDCSDGESFSFLNISRFRNIIPDNQTTCALSVLQKATVCIRLCNTDFCNGPSAGSYVVASIVTTIALVVMAALLAKL